VEPPVITSWGADSGVPGDGVTNDQTITLIGTAPPGSTVVVSIGPDHLGDTTADEDGNWTFETRPLPEGLHEFTAVAETPIGTSVPSNEVGITIDITPPAVSLGMDPASDSGVSNTDRITRLNPVLTGQTEAGAEVDLFRGDKLLGTVKADTSGRFTWTDTTAPKGVHDYRAEAHDPAGNTGSADLAVTVDRSVAPTLPDLAAQSDSGISATDNLTNARNLVIEGQADPGATVTLTWGFVSAPAGSPAEKLGTVVADGNGHWTYVWTDAVPWSTASAVQVTARASDVAGNASAPQNLTITLDRYEAATAPVLAPGSDSGVSPGGYLTNVSRPTFVQGALDAGLSEVILYKNGQEIARPQLDQNGRWAWTPDAALADGTYRIAVVEVDRAGNRSAPAFRDVTVDTVILPPPFTVTEVAPLSSTSSNVRIAGTSEPFATVAVALNGSTKFVAFADSTGRWQQPSGVAVFAVADGDTVRAVATDRAGNVSAPSAYSHGAPGQPLPTTPAVDLLAGSDSGRSDTDNLTNLTILRFAVTSSPDAVLTLQFSGDPGGPRTASAGPTGTVIVEFTAPADGSYRLLATAANGAGQAGPGFGEVWVQVDRATVTPTAVFDPSSDTGASYSDRLTSDTTPPLWAPPKRAPRSRSTLTGSSRAPPSPPMEVPGA
jgi:hypothetical protein